ncbi:MAG TPA: 3'-5' exonuclease, partial [Candidatus Saccharimonadia bacterium]|nr:3'-5' exonuclease [Candidatus Saccharimonadia bacterium]
RLFEEQLLVAQIPYRVYGGLRFFDRAEVKDALAYLRLVANRHDDAAFERAVNTPPRGIGERTIETVRARSRRESTSLWDAVLGEIAGSELAGRSRNALRGFIETIEQLARDTRGLTMAEQFEQVIERAQLKAYYENDARGPSESRLENLEELVNVANRFVLTAEDRDAGLTELTAFLSAAALEAGEGEGEAWQPCVQLMSLHSAKGLEFPLVFVAGLEDGLFPSTKSLDEPGRLEEERRLAYVGITRARRKLVLSYAESRRIHGSENYNRPSRFLAELPRELLFEVRPRVQVTRPSGFGRDASQWLATRNQAHASIEVPSFRMGQRVQHARFGEGVVTDYEGAGAHARVQVNFEDEGAKWLVLAYANLTAL